MMHLLETERRALLATGRRPFETCHASTVVALPGGRRLVAFFAGQREAAGDTAIWLCHGGPSGWEAPERCFAEAGQPHWNPVLHAEGDEIWLFYKVGASVHEWTTRIARSRDGGRSWTSPRALVPGDPAPRGPVKNKLIVLSDGAWLAPGSVEDDRAWDAFTDRSVDGGINWERSDVPLTHRSGRSDTGEPWEGLAADALWETDPARVFGWDGVIQPTLWESAPGSVHMLLRSTRGRVYRSDSRDGGRSWAPAYKTALPNNNSGLDLARLPDGRLLLAYNPVEGNWGRRTPLSLVGSADQGQTWQPVLQLETGPGEFSYPAIVAADDTLHLTYTANRTDIIYRRFLVSDASPGTVEAGIPASGTADNQ
ncbi:MAG: exo-alpha-sialidase [Acidisphaera sp.]|nr:exo-alpha-sialidase [Acidisphaera sp.]